MKKLSDLLSRKKQCPLILNIEGSHVTKYRLFRTFLRHNYNAVNHIAEMEQMYYGGSPFSLASARIKYEWLLEDALGVIYALNAMSKDRYASLYAAVEEIDRKLSDAFKPGRAVMNGKFVLPFEEITPDMKNIVGAKAANLAYIRNSAGLNVPDGFAISAKAFYRFMDEGGLADKISKQLARMSSAPAGELEKTSALLKEMVLGAPVPPDVAEEIISAYEAIEGKTCKGVRVAMRSSAVGEDTEATFAGQFETVLNVGGADIIKAYKTVVAGKYSPRAISYRLDYGLEDMEIPMCAAVVRMIAPAASGVMYTVDPSSGDPGLLRISSVPGLGELLVEGSASPDTFVVSRKEKNIVQKEISRKEQRLVNKDAGGVEKEEVPDPEKELPSIDDNEVIKLAGYGLLLEGLFGAWQDIEWSLDKGGNLFILQSRPLYMQEVKPAADIEEWPDADRLLLSGGQTASRGAASGRIFILKQEGDLAGLPENAILVTKTSSPRYARAMSRIKGLITEIGSAASHLASVAREFGVPAIVDMKDAVSSLPQGELVTMVADTATVYRGAVPSLLNDRQPVKKNIFESPVHRRMRGILDNISLLNLTDPASPLFTPEGCRTFHDIIRFSHEVIMKEMFGITGAADSVRSVKLTAKIPLVLRLIDLGGGLRSGLTTCNVITPEDIESIPMRAVWKGFTHPGITWEGTINLSAKNIMTLLAVSATSEFGEAPGGTSYAILSRDYLNLSAKFAYHFATIDALCSENSSQNYISIQFSGGAGNYYGRSLRIQFLGIVLDRLGFQVSINGDLINAFAMGHDKKDMEDMLDKMARLLASSRLLDMAFSNQYDVEQGVTAFFRGEYDLLSGEREDRLKGFYTHGGLWRQAVEEGRACCVQDGSRSGYTISSGVAGIMGKIAGTALQDFLDNIEAYYYFPIAIVRDLEIAEGTVNVKVKPAGGHIDRAGGLAFGIRDVNNYFVLRTNALEDNVILFEFLNSRRIKRASVNKTIETDKWHTLRVDVKGGLIQGYLNGEQVIEYVSDKQLKGFVGLWTKADSVTYFDELVIEIEGRKREIVF
ncbi:MAG: pyruvate, phosphate dikinase [Deltaproteobacteria bacterium]|nr:pyruvate, phosphate dikinase [Deltaproteobacteria bacterium]